MFFSLRALTGKEMVSADKLCDIGEDRTSNGLGQCLSILLLLPERTEMLDP